MPTAQQMLVIARELDLCYRSVFAVRGGRFSMAEGFTACQVSDDTPRFFITHVTLGRPVLHPYTVHEVNGAEYCLGNLDVSPYAACPDGWRRATYAEMRRYAHWAGTPDSYIYSAPAEWPAGSGVGRLLLVRYNHSVKPATTYTKVGATLRSDTKAPWWEPPEPGTEHLSLERLQRLGIKRGVHVYREGTQLMLIDLANGRKWRPSERLNTKAWLIFGFTS